MEMLKYKHPHEAVNIPVERLRDTGFTEEDVKVFKDVFSFDGYREIFGDDDGNLTDYDLKFIGVGILSTSEIIHDHELAECQIYRSGGNGESTKILANIEKEGYKLKEIPAVVVKINGEYYIWDGRTRHKAETELGIPNRLVIAYELVGSLATAQRFGMFMNTIGSPKGYANEEDVMTFITSKAKSGTLELAEGPESKLNSRLEKAINLELRLCGMKLGATKLNNLVLNLAQNLYGQLPVRVISNAEEAKEIGRREYGLIDTSEYIYIFTTPDTGVGDKKVQDAIVKYPGVEIRIVYYESDPNPKNLLKTFQKRMLSIAGDHYKKYVAIGEAMFDGASPSLTRRVVTWGGIPYLTSMADEYPMDKLIDMKPVMYKFKHCIDKVA